MASPEVSELLERAAPAPRAALGIGQIERRARRRRRRRRVSSTVVCVAVVGLLIGLAAGLPGSPERTTVVLGPPSPRRVPVKLHAGVATTELGLLDGSRLRLTLPEAAGRGLAGVTLAHLELRGSLYAGPAPHGWAIDVTLDSIERLVPGGEPIVVPPSSRASAATVDRPGHRLALQFGSWALVASGDSLTVADIDVLLSGVALAETPDGFVEYRGALPLWSADNAAARLGGASTTVSVLLGGCSQMNAFPRVTAGGLELSPQDPGAARAGAELCDRAGGLRIILDTPRPLTDEEIDRVRVDVVSLGSTLAALQRGEHP